MWIVRIFRIFNELTVGFVLSAVNSMFCSVYRPPLDIDSKTTITVNEQTFQVDADDLETICHLGKGAYGIVEKMRHRGSGTIMAVKVSQPPS